MLKRIIYPFLLMGLVSMLSCSNNMESVNEESQTSNQVRKDLSVEDFKNIISEKTIVLDVRRAVEFQAGHLENAINIDFFSSNFVAEVSKLDNSKKLLIYCASGGRSSGAMNKLADSGFSEMYNMLGGFGAWRKANFDYVK